MIESANSLASDDEPTLEDLMKRLRGLQLYMVRMEMVEPSTDPIPVLTPHLREHLLWLRDQERSGALFLSGAHRDEVGWDGSGTAILRAKSRQEATEIAETEPFHREGVRRNSVHGWELNEGHLRLSFQLFSDQYELS
ncbi:YciI family protein [Streptomyces mirabilis]|uniref:YciI family protein n=1 Tax=Streptomyces mirabilis TaxID=68239 RepID=UPI0036AC327C